MAISRKPKEAELLPTEQIEALIQKGGSIAGEISKIKGSKEKAVMLRIPASLDTQIDKVLERKIIKKPRHTWILEAIAEKLEREQDI